MGKIQTKTMDLNHETALRLWNKQFGNATKVKDFAGREIAKGAYNDRKSKFGWNVDHILPQSQGGKTADYNLVCCHILTNDEKADKFPGFVANDKRFNIIKVQNHYEYKQVGNDVDAEKEEAKNTNGDNINFMDSASGVGFFKDLKGIQNKARFVGTVLVRIKGVKNNAIIDFIERFFNEENISFEKTNNDYLYWGTNDEIRILLRDYNMPLKEDISKLLDKCIILNTYMSNYFLPKEYVDSYEIVYRVDCYKDKASMYEEAYKVNLSNINGSFNNSLYINNLVIENTEAKEKVREDINDNYVQYGYIFTELSKNLKKEASK